VKPLASLLISNKQIDYVSTSVKKNPNKKAICRTTGLHFVVSLRPICAFSGNKALSALVYGYDSTRVIIELSAAVTGLVISRTMNRIDRSSGLAFVS